jgi:hypothetical protein
MKTRALRSPAAQLNLPLPHRTPCLVPEDQQAALVVALVELLIRAAHAEAHGGDDESEADR